MEVRPHIQAVLHQRLEINTVDVRGSQADVRHNARRPAIVAGCTRGVGLRASPAGKGAGYPSIATRSPRTRVVYVR